MARFLQKKKKTVLVSFVEWFLNETKKNEVQQQKYLQKETRKKKCTKEIIWMMPIHYFHGGDISATAFTKNGGIFSSSCAVTAAAASKVADGS